MNATGPYWWQVNMVQVMAWCRQATSHYLSQCWLSSVSPYDVARPQWFNSKWYFVIIIQCLMAYLIDASSTINNRITQKTHHEKKNTDIFNLSGSEVSSCMSMFWWKSKRLFVSRAKILTLQRYVDTTVVSHIVCVDLDATKMITKHWNGNYVILTKVSLLTVPKVVIFGFTVYMTYIWHMCVYEKGHHCFRQWFDACPATRHYLWSMQTCSHITKTLGSTSIKHRSDAKVSDRCLINVVPRVSAVWVVYWAFRDTVWKKISKIKNLNKM